MNVAIVCQDVYQPVEEAWFSRWKLLEETRSVDVPRALKIEGLTPERLLDWVALNNHMTETIYDTEVSYESVRQLVDHLGPKNDGYLLHVNLDSILSRETLLLQLGAEVRKRGMYMDVHIHGLLTGAKLSPRILATRKGRRYRLFELAILHQARLRGVQILPENINWRDVADYLNFHWDNYWRADVSTRERALSSCQLPRALAGLLPNLTHFTLHTEYFADFCILPVLKYVLRIHEDHQRALFTLIDMGNLLSSQKLSVSKGVMGQLGECLAKCIMMPKSWMLSFAQIERLYGKEVLKGFCDLVLLYMSLGIENQDISEEAEYIVSASRTALAQSTQREELVDDE